MSVSKTFPYTVLTVIFGCCFFLSSLSAGTVTYVPSSYTTISGSDNQQPVENLQNLNNAGMSDLGGSVQFNALTSGSTYSGFRSYYVDPLSSPTSIQVLANYKGASSANQTWTWQIYDWVYNGWVTIGTNAMAFNFGPWTVLNFNVGGPCSNYVNASTGELRIGFTSNNTNSDALLDYESVVITTDTSPRSTLSYFVSPTGNDANPGTFSQPWKTISRAALMAMPGSTVYVRGGVYSERVLFKVSGTPQAGPITFMSFPGESAIIDGTNVKIPSPAGAGPSGLLQLTNVNYVTVQGFEIRNITSTSNFVGGIAIEGRCDHIEIHHNHIHHLSSNNGGGHGLSAYGTTSPIGITNLIIDGNELNNLALGQSESLTVNGNVQYWAISNNIVHDNNNIGIDAIGAEGTASSTYDQARNGSITGNLIYNIDDNQNPTYPANDNSADGIYVDGGASILIDGNIVHHNNIGIELASEHSGHNTSNVIVSNNIVYMSTGPGISMGGYSTRKGGTDHCSVLNNTLFNNDTFKTGSGELQLQYFPSTTSNNIVENNIFYSNNQGTLVSNPFASPKVYLNYNVFYTPNGASPEWQWNKKYYTSFKNYKAATGNDANSFFANPQFVNTGTPILYVLSTSPAVNSGINLGASLQGSKDISGHARVQGSNSDIGAYEQ